MDQEEARRRLADTGERLAEQLHKQGVAVSAEVQALRMMVIMLLSEVESREEGFSEFCADSFDHFAGMAMHTATEFDDETLRASRAKFRAMCDFAKGAGARIRASSAEEKAQKPLWQRISEALRP